MLKFSIGLKKCSDTKLVIVQHAFYKHVFNCGTIYIIFTAFTDDQLIISFLKMCQTCNLNYTTLNCLGLVDKDPEHVLFEVLSGHHLLTFIIAGSCGNGDCASCGDGFGGSQTWISLISEPLNMMYSNTSSLGATGRSVGRSSVPNDLTAKHKRKELLSHYKLNESGVSIQI